VGCGEGRLWEASPRLLAGTPITLVDLSAGMVAAAVDRIGRLVPGPVAVGAVADVEQLPFPDRSFDAIVANHMLYHASDPASAVAEIARLLGPDGLLVAATNGPRHLAELGEIRAEVFGIRPLDDTLAVFGMETGRPLLEAGFADVEWVAYDDRLVCTDPDDVLAYLRSVPPGEGATSGQDARMEAAVRDRFEQGGNSMIISKESGVFVCRRPRRS
jgi:SAM-dependent methyltransferase